ncbi:hypothetical protein [Antrihabitans sp. YC2-6]|uniref:hypothetical protein n=1 Tax=Antrihabitans sp. YC2-6 TaxID=2799498 RepID=UPI0018F797FA|nr:hypothetical protein [Antrihabitans sp. YC2-6]MBJ8343937.1 hypothetical protein [Antrihabitans sp. YC2-6]
MSNEISSNNGYFSLKKEPTEGVAVIPTTFVPIYDETIATLMNPETENSVIGQKFARQMVTPGIRSHGGDVTIMAEPNSTAMLLDMLLTRGSITGSDPYTWPFTASFTNPFTYTVDISTGNQVMRFMGVQASELAPEFVSNEARWKVKLSALKSFLGAEIASVSTNVVTLKTPINYPSPSDGLVATDLVAVVNQTTGARQDFTVTSLTSTTVTLSGSPSGVTSGDMLVLRPATPSKNFLYPFLWSRTEFRFGATASAALSATHTPLEEGSEFTILHPFEDEKGAPGSGSFDPRALVRSKSVDVTFKAKKFFRNPDEVRNFKALSKVACVIRMFSGSTGQHEFRLTLNNLTVTKGGDKPMIKVDEALYYELEYTPSQDDSDGQAMDVKVINALSS